MSEQIATYGGKAQGLYELKSLGFKVPDFITLFHDKISSLNVELLDKLLVDLSGNYFSVRSSANLEDGTANSFAGIFTTKLFVERTDLFSAVQRVFRSAQSEIAQAYCNVNSISHEQLKMNVIIQEMIAADVSGVAFGIDPLKPYKKENRISAVWGLGEGLVSGQLNADEYSISYTNTISKKIADKAQAFVFENEALGYKNVVFEKRTQACLSETQLWEVTKVLDSLNSHYGQPQDLEFCYQDKQLFLLQSRPITTLEKEHIIWDNSNIVESYPGVTLPFTFSFIIKLYEAVYKNFVQLLGVPKSNVEENSQVFANMLGHINGRVYYHLIHWYQALALLPAYQLNAGFMENMMGVSEPLGVAVEQPQRNKFYNYFLMVKMLFRSIRINRRLPKLKKQFTERVSLLIKEYKKKDYTDKKTKQVWNDYLHFKNILVNDWFPPLANDLYAMIYFGTLQSLCKKWLHDESIPNAWIVGRHEVKSAQPALLVEEILNALKEEHFFEKFKENTKEENWTDIKNGSLGAAGKLILHFIENYGDRSVGELKIENETYTQNPMAFIAVLQSYNNSIAREKPELVEPDLSKLSFIKKRVLKYVARKSAELVADRENLRFDRTFAFGMARRFLGIVSKRWQTEGIIQEQKDIFYLQEEEIEAFINEELSQSKVQEIIKERKFEFDVYFNESALPERIHQWDGNLDLEKEVLITEDHKNIWKGIACCAGKVEAKVRIVERPDEVKSLEGDILVCTSTDPGWISIFRSASAILVERGSALSHAAIVCREMGIPCIVGLKGIANQLKTGDTVRMNGQTGVVEKL